MPSAKAEGTQPKATIEHATTTLLRIVLTPRNTTHRSLTLRLRTGKAINVFFKKRVGGLSAIVPLSDRLRDGLVPLHIVCLAARQRLNKRTLQLQRVAPSNDWNILVATQIVRSRIEYRKQCSRATHILAAAIGHFFLKLLLPRISRISLPGDRAHVPDLSQRQLAGSPEGGLFYCLARSLFPKQHAHPQSLFMCT